MKKRKLPMQNVDCIEKGATTKLKVGAKRQTNLANVPVVIQGLAGEKMNGADLPQHPPAGAVRPENDVLIVVSDVLGAGVGRAVGEVRIMDLQELGRHGSGSCHDDVNEA